MKVLRCARFQLLKPHRSNGLHSKQFVRRMNFGSTRRSSVSSAAGKRITYDLWRIDLDLDQIIPQLIRVLSRATAYWITGLVAATAANDFGRRSGEARRQLFG
jgi:hypothetical protein